MKRLNVGRMRCCTMPAAVLLGVLGYALFAQAVTAATLGTFGHCPVSDPAMIEHGGGLCMYARTDTGSSLTLGNAVLPLRRPLVLQGGTWIEPGTTMGALIAAQGAPTLRPAGEPVPGGLAALIDPSLLSGETLARYETLVARGRTRAWATLELAGPASAIGFSLTNLLGARAPALTVPLKIRLHGDGHLLGASCYLGSDAAPIELRLTDGATTPPPPARSIAGKVGTPTESPSEIVSVSENTLVENAFTLAPVTGCGGDASSQAQLDTALNARLGLPSRPGSSVAVLESTLGAAPGTRVGAAGHAR